MSFTPRATTQLFRFQAQVPIKTSIRFNSTTATLKNIKHPSKKQEVTQKCYHTRLPRKDPKYTDEFNTHKTCESTFIKLKEKACPFG